VSVGPESNSRFSRSYRERQRQCRRNLTDEPQETTPQYSAAQQMLPNFNVAIVDRSPKIFRPDHRRHALGKADGHIAGEQGLPSSNRKHFARRPSQHT
jgi:hypothetical protein